MREGCFDFGSPHRVGMPDAVEAEVALDPRAISLFGAKGKVPQAARVANLVEEFYGDSLRRLTRKKRVRPHDLAHSAAHTRTKFQNCVDTFSESWYKQDNSVESLVLRQEA